MHLTHIDYRRVAAGIALLVSSEYRLGDGTSAGGFEAAEDTTFCAFTSEAVIAKVRLERVVRAKQIIGNFIGNFTVSFLCYLELEFDFV